jgi:hypothetical protein
MSQYAQLQLPTLDMQMRLSVGCERCQRELAGEN